MSDKEAKVQLDSRKEPNFVFVKLIDSNYEMEIWWSASPPSEHKDSNLQASFSGENSIREAHQWIEKNKVKAFVVRSR